MWSAGIRGSTYSQQTQGLLEAYTNHNLAATLIGGLWKKSAGHYGHYYTDQKNKSVVFGNSAIIFKSFLPRAHVYRVIEIIVVFQNQIEIYVCFFFFFSTTLIGFRECLLLFLHYEIEPVTLLFFRRVFFCCEFIFDCVPLFIFIFAPEYECNILIPFIKSVFVFCFFLVHK